MNGMWGTDGVESTIVYPFIDPSQEGYQNAETDWQFVEPEAYEIYQAKKLLLQQLETASETGYADVSAYEPYTTTIMRRQNRYKKLPNNCNKPSQITNCPSWTKNIRLISPEESKTTHSSPTPIIGTSTVKA